MGPSQHDAAGLGGGVRVRVRSIGAVRALGAARPKRLPALCMVAAACLQPAAWSADIGDGATRLMVVPSLSVTQTASDNYLVTGLNPAYDQITRLTAGVGLRAQTGVLRGFLDYSLSQLAYLRHRDRNTLQNLLNADLNADLAEGRAKIDVAASISQQALSAFAAQPGSSGLPQANSTEVRTLRISPAFRGPVGPDMRYTAQLGYNLTDAKASAVGDSNTASALLHLEPSNKPRLGWAVDASHLRSDFKTGRVTTDDRLTGALNLGVPLLDLELSANAGAELTDLATIERQRYSNWGVGAVWTPSAVTKLTAQFDHRFFGGSHAVVFEHRTPQTIWRLSDSRSLSTSGTQNSGGQGTAYDLFYRQFASVEPDPVRRAALVNAFLASRGIESGTEASFLRSTATLQRRQEASVAWRGVRSTALLTFTQSLTERVGAVVNARDDLSQSSRVKLRGLSLDLSHRLTPLSSVSLLLNAQQGDGNLANQHNRQRQLGLTYNLRPRADSTLVLGLRRALFETALLPYGETALFATYGIRF